MSDREREALRDILDAMLPELVFMVAHSYRVRSATVAAGPPRQVKVTADYEGPRPGLLPNVVNIVVWPGPSGSYAKPAAGSLVRVGFVDADPTKPAIVGLDPNVPPDEITLGEAGDYVALASKVADFLTAYNAHTHAVNGPAFTPSAINFASSKVRVAT